MLRAILQTCKNGGFDLGEIMYIFDYDECNSYLINESLTWSFLGKDNMGDFER